MIIVIVALKAYFSVIFLLKVKPHVKTERIYMGVVLKYLDVKHFRFRHSNSPHLAWRSIANM